MNANPQGSGLTLNISESDNSLDPELALSVAVHFRLKPQEAKAILEQIKNAAAQWSKIATKYKLSRREQENIAPAFSGV
jgi:serine/threonine-protein kinase HipA